MATRFPSETLHSCEICGQEDLSEEDMRSHFRIAHLEGSVSCPLCGLEGNLSQTQMADHVNEAHLDYLSPTKKVSSETPDSKAINGSSSDEYFSNIENESPPKRRKSKSDDFLSKSKSDKNSTSTSDSLDNETILANGKPYHNKTLPSDKSDKSDELSCPMCPYTDFNSSNLERHVNSHLDQSQEELSSLNCPFCSVTFPTPERLEEHVHADHSESPSDARKTNGLLEGPVCPVCGETFWSNDQLQLHVESHFNATPSRNNATLSNDVDMAVARQLEDEEREQRRKREEKEFSELQKEFGMAGGSHSRQKGADMEKAVYKGQMSVVDYHERRVAEGSRRGCGGLDDGSSVSKGLIDRIRTLSLASRGVTAIKTASNTDHFSSTYGDKGWGCGFRNLQMLLSCLLRVGEFRESLVGGTGCEGVPSIAKLQSLVEEAWRKGFDTAGAAQLGGNLVNTRKWIGTTEIAALLSSCRIDTQVIDFHKPTGEEGTHPAMFEWMEGWFSRGGGGVIPPLYLQHQGHSRTVVGVERATGGQVKLLIFDPSHSKAQMGQLRSGEGMRLVRKTLASMKSRQYQVVSVLGVIQSQELLESKKIVASKRIP